MLEKTINHHFSLVDTIPHSKGRPTNSKLFEEVKLFQSNSQYKYNVDYTIEGVKLTVSLRDSNLMFELIDSVKSNFNNLLRKINQLDCLVKIRANKTNQFINKYGKIKCKKVYCRNFKASKLLDDEVEDMKINLVDLKKIDNILTKFDQLKKLKVIDIAKSESVHVVGNVKTQIEQLHLLTKKKNLKLFILPECLPSLNTLELQKSQFDFNTSLFSNLNELILRNCSINPSVDSQLKILRVITLNEIEITSVETKPKYLEVVLWSGTKIYSD